MYYRLDWYATNKPKEEYHGKWTNEKELIQAAIKKGNTDYPNLIHYMRYAEDPDKSYPGAQFM